MSRLGWKPDPHLSRSRNRTLAHRSDEDRDLVAAPRGAYRLGGAGRVAGSGLVQAEPWIQDVVGHRCACFAQRRRDAVQRLGARAEKERLRSSDDHERAWFARRSGIDTRDRKVHFYELAVDLDRGQKPVIRVDSEPGAFGGRDHRHYGFGTAAAFGCAHTFLISEGRRVPMMAVRDRDGGGR